ncbi:MAG: Trp family transcriptional regulator [bacterium]|nr:Trp family transcriptional regulator [bacterium]
MKHFDELMEELMKIKDKSIMKNFLLGLFTPQELEEIPTRVQIIKMLKKGIPQHEIAKKLGIGIATVTRGSSEVKKGRFINIKP